MSEAEKESGLNHQIGGAHYKKYGECKPWQILSIWLSPEEFIGFMKGTAIAYLARERDKGGRDDIKKAMNVIQLYLELTDSTEEKEDHGH